MKNGNPSIKQICSAVSEATMVSVHDIMSDRRAQPIVETRHVAMYLARQLTLHGYPTIGRAFNDRDHTTIMHACRRVEADPLLVRRAEAIATANGWSIENGPRAVEK